MSKKEKVPKKTALQPANSKLFWYVFAAAFPVVLALLAARFYFNFGSDTDILRPLIEPPINISSLTWSSYRAQHYFGLRMRHEASPLFGMMWFEQPPNGVMPRIRHWCDQGDGLNSYGWTEADGRTFGRQTINDTFGIIQTDWLASGEAFSARVTSNAHKKTPKELRTNFFFYLALESESHGSLSMGPSPQWSIVGKSKALGEFTLTVQSPQKDKTFVTDLLLEDASSPRYHDYLLQNMRASQTQYGVAYVLAQNPSIPKKDIGRFAVLAINAPVTAEFEITFLPKSLLPYSPPIGEAFKSELTKKVKQFDELFEEAFQLEGKGYTDAQKRMARVALSNMVGSIGLWRGYNKVSRGGGAAVPYGPHTLLSAVPSRPFFPRGFLWDEGFHQLLISRFNYMLSLECIVSWLNTMNTNGWIPREMILTPEAEAKVPAEFVAQHPEVANPPSFFYLLDTMTQGSEEFVKNHKEIFAPIYKRAAIWFAWLRNSQAGPTADTFRWRGRNETTKKELNPKTLPSGLDDFPRATHPNSKEYHVDLRCWMAVSSRVMARLAGFFGTQEEAASYRRLSERLSDFSTLVARHWSEEGKMFADYGLHSLKVHMEEKARVIRTPQGNVVEKYQERVVEDPPRERHVNDALGYVALFPLLTRLIPVKEEKYIKATLDHLTNPDELWTEYGIRSISTTSPYYLARNTEHDAPYWRGPIWMPINYLVLKALREYAEDEEISPSLRERVVETHRRLKKALVGNLGKEFERTGYLWEHYDDRSGKGGGSHPMTGWTSLIVLVMSEPDLQ